MATVTLNQNVANSPTNSYPVGVFKQTNGTELQAIVMVDSTGVEYNVGNPLPISGSFSASLATASTSTGTLATATTASSVVLAANPGVRKGGWVKNIGSITAFVSLSGTAATNKPTQLEPGDSIPLVQYGAVIYTGAVSAITAASTTTLEVVELS